MLRLVVRRSGQKNFVYRGCRGGYGRWRALDLKSQVEEIVRTIEPLVTVEFIVLIAFHVSTQTTSEHLQYDYKQTIRTPFGKQYNNHCTDYSPIES
jgi:xylose isomerase